MVKKALAFSLCQLVIRRTAFLGTGRYSCYAVCTMQAADGRQIRAAKAILGLSQEGLALASGAHRNKVSAAERECSTPGIAVGRTAEAAGQQGTLFERRDGRAVTFPAGT